MSQQGAFWPLAALMFAAGLGIPVLAALNSDLGRQLGSPIVATWVTFMVGLVLATGMLLATDLPVIERFTFERPQIYFGVVFMLFYILSITWAAPRIGLGNAIFFVLIGQLIAAAAIDHFGWLGAMRSPITAKRAAGIAVMALGVYLARKPV